MPKAFLLLKLICTIGPQQGSLRYEYRQHDGNENVFDGLDLVDPNSPIWLEEDGISVEINPPVQRKNVLDTKPLRFTAKAFSFK